MGVDDSGGTITLQRAPLGTRTTATATQLLEIWQHMGLDPDNPMTLTPGGIYTAGGVTRTAVETAGPVVTTTRTPL
jgi:hypothetical protein